MHYLFRKKVEENGEKRTLVREFDVDFNSLPGEALHYLLDYGFKQSVADSYASATTAAEFESAIEERVQRILDGTMSSRSRETDSLKLEMRKIGHAAVSGALKKKGIKLNSVTAEKMRELVSDYIEKNFERVEEEAKRRLAALETEDDILAGVDVGALTVNQESEGEAAPEENQE